MTFECSPYCKMSKGHGKKEEKPYGIVVGRTVQITGQKPFKQVQRMPWSYVDVDASRSAGKCREDIWKEWCKLIKSYHANKIKPKEVPPQMLEFVLIENQSDKPGVLDVPPLPEATDTHTPGVESAEEELPLQKEEEEEIQEDEKEDENKPKQVKDLKCPDYFFKTEHLKRQSKKPALFVEQAFATPQPKVKNLLT